MISPSNVDFLTFANSLTTDFPRDIILVEPVESDWNNWGNKIASSTTFAQAGVPRTESFGSWREWASRVYGIMG